MATEMAWNQLATDLGCITPPHTIANITGLKNHQVFLPHPVPQQMISSVMLSLKLAHAMESYLILQTLKFFPNFLLSLFASNQVM